MKNVVYNFVVFVLFSLPIIGQEATNKRVTFGINAGVNPSFMVGQSNQTQSSFLTTTDRFGFNLGILLDIQLKKRFYISPRAELHLNNAEYQLGNNFVYYQQRIRPQSLEFKTYFTFFRNPSGTSPYIFGEPNFRFAINTTNTPTLWPAINDLTLDLGVGLRNSLKHVNFSPEIRYSFGFKSLSINPTVDYIRMHSVQLVFNLSER